MMKYWTTPASEFDIEKTLIALHPPVKVYCKEHKASHPMDKRPLSMNPEILLLKGTVSTGKRLRDGRF